MITQESCEPGTSTPCQKLAVANRTAFGVERKRSSSVERGAVPCSSKRKVDAAGDALVNVSHLSVAGEEAEGAAFGDFEKTFDFVGGAG